MEDSRPTLLLTRPEPAARRFLKELAELGVHLPSIVSPVLEIQPLPPDRPIEDYPELVLTSENALIGLPRGALEGHRVWAVGSRAAQAAREAGADEVREAAGDADALVQRILADRPAGPLLHLRGRHARGRVVSRLTLAGLEAAEVVVYDQRARPLSGAAQSCLARPGRVILPLFSPRSAALVSAEAGQPVADLTVIAISPAAARGWNRRPAAYVVDRPDAKAMAEAVACAAKTGQLVDRRAPR